MLYTLDSLKQRFKEEQVVTILIMDDDAGTREALGEWLQCMFVGKEKINLLVAADPKAAHQLLANVCVGDVGCIIADVQQPRFRDWQFIDELLAEGEIPTAKIIAISGCDLDLLNGEASRRGIPYLSKPISAQKFMAAVRLACLWKDKPTA